MIDTLFPAGWQHYLIGGLWLGAGIAVLYLFTGLVGSMSTVFSSTWSWLSNAPYFRQPRFVGSRAWRGVFAIGLVLGATLWLLAVPPHSVVLTTIPAWQLLLGGFLVGFGARLSNGCISGHGICGLASLHWPSAAAVMMFMATAIGTANLTWWMWGL